LWYNEKAMARKAVIILNKEDRAMIREMNDELDDMKTALEMIVEDKKCMATLSNKGERGDDSEDLELQNLESAVTQIEALIKTLDDCSI
jgi:hypothetical protein